MSKYEIPTLPNKPPDCCKTNTSTNSTTLERSGRSIIYTKRTLKQYDPAHTSPDSNLPYRLCVE
jgi:hypothetical protein